MQIVLVTNTHWVNRCLESRTRPHPLRPLPLAPDPPTGQPDPRAVRSGPSQLRCRDLLTRPTTSPIVSRTGNRSRAGDHGEVLTSIHTVATTIRLYRGGQARSEPWVGAPLPDDQAGHQAPLVVLKPKRPDPARLAFKVGANNGGRWVTHPIWHSPPPTRAGGAPAAGTQTRRLQDRVAPVPGRVGAVTAIPVRQIAINRVLGHGVDFGVHVVQFGTFIPLIILGPLSEELGWRGSSAVERGPDVDLRCLDAHDVRLGTPSACCTMHHVAGTQCQRQAA